MALAFFRPTFCCRASPDLSYLSCSVGIELETVVDVIDNSTNSLLRLLGSCNSRLKSLQVFDVPLPANNIERLLCGSDLEGSSSPVNTSSTEISIIDAPSNSLSSSTRSSTAKDKVLTLCGAVKNVLVREKIGCPELLYRTDHEVVRRFLIRDLYGLPEQMHGKRLVATLLRYRGARAELLACCQENSPWVPCYFFYLYARSWDQMHQIVRDLDEMYPTWELMYQLVHKE